MERHPRGGAGPSRPGLHARPPCRRARALPGPPARHWPIGQRSRSHRRLDTYQGAEMARIDYEVIIAGGGLGGSTRARALAERSARVLIVEREEQFKDRVRGEGMLSVGGCRGSCSRDRRTTGRKVRRRSAIISLGSPDSHRATHAEREGAGALRCWAARRASPASWARCRHRVAAGLHDSVSPPVDKLRHPAVPGTGRRGATADGPDLDFGR
jgi:FAD binding domain-containing protein